MVSALEPIERQQHVDKALWAITWYRISCQYLQVAKMREDLSPMMTEVRLMGAIPASLSSALRS